MANTYIQNPTAVTPATWSGAQNPKRTLGSTHRAPSVAPTHLVAVACLLVSVASFAGVLQFFGLFDFGAVDSPGLVLYLGMFASTTASNLAVGQALIRSVWLSAFGALVAIGAAIALIVGMPADLAQDELLLWIFPLAIAALSLVASVIGLLGSLGARTQSKPGAFVWLALGTATIAIVVRTAWNMSQWFGADIPPSAIVTIVGQLLINATAFGFLLALGIRHPAARGLALGLLAVLTLLQIGVEAFTLVGRLDALDPVTQLRIVALALRVALYGAAAVCIVVSFPRLLHWRRSVSSQHR